MQDYVNVLLTSPGIAKDALGCVMLCVSCYHARRETEQESKKRKLEMDHDQREETD